MGNSRLLATAAVLGFFGVALGAFAAHGLDLEGKPAEWWHTGSQYHLIHALAAGLAATFGAEAAGWCFVAGSVVFAGSLYAMALTHVTVLGVITPIGGVLFLIGWALLAKHALRTPKPIEN